MLMEKLKVLKLKEGKHINIDLYIYVIIQLLKTFICSLFSALFIAKITYVLTAKFATSLKENFSYCEY